MYKILIFESVFLVLLNVLWDLLFYKYGRGKICRNTQNILILVPFLSKKVTGTPL